MDYLEAVIEDLSNTGLGTRDLEKDLEDKKQKQGGLQKDIAELLTELDEGTQVVNEFQVRTFPSLIYHVVNDQIIYFEDISVHEYSEFMDYLVIFYEIFIMFRTCSHLVL